MTKKEKLRKLDLILESHDLGSEVIGSPRDYLLEICSACERYRKLALDPGSKFYVGNYKIASGRKVRMVFLQSGGRKVPLSKKNLFPTKKRNPGVNNYASEVRGAMRNMVSNQISEYRSTLPFSFSCFESGLTIRKGMKYDIDHSGKPFVRIADEWLLYQGITYEDVVLSGRPNAKKIKDPALAESWVNYHLEEAELVPVLASVNRSKGCGDYVSPPCLFEERKKESINLEF